MESLYLPARGFQAPASLLVLYDAPTATTTTVMEELPSGHAYNTEFVDDGKPIEWVQTSRESIKTTEGFHDDLGNALKIGSGPQQRDQLLKVFDRFFSEAEEGLELIRKGELLPTQVGGRAGGAKYIWKGLLFKRADDLPISPGHYMYGGEDGPCRHWAGKAASNELKASNTLLRLFFSLNIDVMIPLQTVFDFSGERFVAMSILPLEDATLIYGSADSGFHVHADDENFNALMTRVAEELHLASHSVRRCKTKLCMAGDVEGHRTHDGRYCLLDLARLWPPEEISRPPSSAVFFRLLRPEFLLYLRSIKHPALSPDAFSAWSPQDEEFAMHNSNIQSATKLLRTKRVMECLQYLQNQLENNVPNLELMLSAIPSERAREVIGLALAPLIKKIKNPAHLLPAFNVLLLAHCKDNHTVAFHWNTHQLAENPHWARTYGTFNDDFRIGSVLHKFGVPVRYLPELLEAAKASGVLRNHIRLEVVRRCAKTHMRWLLAHDKAKAYTFLEHIKRGTVDPETISQLNAISEAKYGNTNTSFGAVMTAKQSIIAAYVEETCGVVVTATAVAGENGVETYTLKPRTKLNTFIGVVRAQHHFDIAQGRSPADYEAKLSDLRKALDLCAQVTTSDPSDPEATELQERCRILVALEEVRGVSLGRADRVAVDYSTTLRKWFTFAKRLPSDLALGIDIVGQRMLCLAYAGTLQAELDLLESFADWRSPQEECACLGQAACLGATGLLHALFQLGLSTTRVLNNPLSKGAMGEQDGRESRASSNRPQDGRESRASSNRPQDGTRESDPVSPSSPRDSPVSPRSLLSKSGKFLAALSPKSKKGAVAIGSLVTRDSKHIELEDGGKGHIGQIIARDQNESEQIAAYVVQWSSTNKTQLCPESNIRAVDDQYLQTLCTTRDPRAAWKKRNQRGQMWKAISAVGNFVAQNSEVTLRDVQIAFTSAWRLLCREQDPLILALLRPHLFLNQDLLRTAIKAKYEEGIFALLRLKEASPYAPEGTIPTPDNDAAMYAASLGLEEQVIVMFRARPLFGLRKMQLLFTAVDVGATAVATLLNAKIDVRSADDENTTVLHHAARLDQLEVVQLLITRNAMVNAVNTKGQTPVQLCHSQEVRDLLQAACPDPPSKTLSIIHRLETVGIPCAQLSEPAGKLTLLALTTSTFRANLFSSVEGDKNQHRDLIRGCVLSAAHRILQRCNENQMTQVAKEASRIVAQSQVLTTFDTTTAVQNMINDPHIQDKISQSLNRSEAMFHYFAERASKLFYEEDEQPLNSKDICKFHQLDKNAAVVGKSILDEVNVIDLTAITPDREEVLCCLQGSTFADCVLVLCTYDDLSKDKGTSELIELIKRAEKLTKLTPNTTKIRVWMVGLGPAEAEYMRSQDTILHLSDPVRMLEVLSPGSANRMTAVFTRVEMLQFIQELVGPAIALLRLL